MASRKRSRPATIAGVTPAEVPSHTSAAAPQTPATVIATCLQQHDLDLAAASLLPWLESLSAEGQPACGLAATLIRTLMQDPPMPEPLPRIPDDPMAGALLRLTALLRRRETQLDRMTSILTSML